MGVFERFGASFSGAAVDAEVIPRGTGGTAGNGVDGGYGVVDFTYEPDKTRRGERAGTFVY